MQDSENETTDLASSAHSVLDWIFYKDQRFKKHARAWLEDRATQKSENNYESEKLRKVLSDIGIQEEKYAKAYGHDLMDFDQYTKLVGELKNKRKSIISQLKDVKRKQDTKQVEIEVEETGEEK